MVSTVYSIGLTGIDGYVLGCECDLSQGLPSFDIVGLPDTAVKESRERVRAAIKNAGYTFPLKRITVNLSPADTKKEGANFDLPILLSILSSSEPSFKIPDDTCFIGELSLDGKIRAVPGILPSAIFASEAGFKRIVVSCDNADEASFADGIDVLYAENVNDVIAHIKGEKPLEIYQKRELIIENDDFFDFKDVKGQESVKRALEIAAAGGHNILLIGPPGSGKSMMAKCLPSILPDMSKDEILDVTKIHSVAGLTKKENPIITRRPVRTPHHTLSSAALTGGGRIPKPGEISLSHHGVLFLDELPEFKKDALEILRQPLEDGQVTISRVASTVSYPCRFMLVCAMNPCKCGFFGHHSNKCSCAEEQVRKYRGRVSGPLMDRIDIHIEVPAVNFDEISSKSHAEPSCEIKKRVDNARLIQRKRFEGTNISSNAQMTPSQTKRLCSLGATEESLLKNAFEKLSLTARAYDKVLRVARTIADLEGSENITVLHIAEAIQYRSLDRL